LYFKECFQVILIISSPDDIHAQAVVEQLHKQGIQDVRILNLSEFPMHMDMKIYLRNNLPRQSSLTFADGYHLPMSEVRAIWWRRPQPFMLPPEITDPTYRQFAMAEAATAFQGMWQASSPLWVNNILRDAAAAHKPWQLALAQEVGLYIPETLITNSPDEGRQFWAKYPGEVVYKAFSASTYAWRETRILRPEEEQLADAVRYAPVIFQRYVPAVVDLRITAIGTELYAAEAHSQQGEYTIDVRFNTNIPYKPHTLPPEIGEKLLTFMRRLGLEYGAIDMRLTPNGHYVFLEINPAGQFLYVERAAGLPIAAALARHLAAGVPTPSQPS
jgi:glutathione synthase/RimK-type ligase-like ATP-grasp enzyme